MTLQSTLRDKNFVHALTGVSVLKLKKLWREGRKRYVTKCRNKCLTANAESIEEMIAKLRSAADHLEQMQQAGVVLDDEGGMSDDWAQLVTMDPRVAETYGMIDESECWNVDEEDDE